MKKLILALVMLFALLTAAQVNQVVFTTPITQSANATNTVYVLGPEFNLDLVSKVNYLPGVEQRHFGAGCQGQTCPGSFPNGSCRTEGTSCVCFCGKIGPIQPTGAKRD